MMMNGDEVNTGAQTMQIGGEVEQYMNGAN
jgi:hypothetical protein